MVSLMSWHLLISNCMAISVKMWGCAIGSEGSSGRVSVRTEQTTDNCTFSSIKEHYKLWHKPDSPIRHLSIAPMISVLPLSERYYTCFVCLSSMINNCLITCTQCIVRWYVSPLSQWCWVDLNFYHSHKGLLSHCRLHSYTPIYFTAVLFLDCGLFFKGPEWWVVCWPFTLAPRGKAHKVLSI